MKLLLNCKALIVLGALLLSSTNAVAQKAKGSFQQTLTIDELVQLDVATGSGTITVRTGQSGRVEVIGHIVVGRTWLRRSAEDAEALVCRFEAEPPVELAGDHLRVGHIRDGAFKHNVSMSYEIEVPVETAVKSHTGSGSQILIGVRGPVEAGTGSGTLTFTDIGGAIEARTGSGAIRAEGIAGAFEAHTGSGSVRLVQVAPGDVVVSTGSGRSELLGINGALRAHAGSGSITVEGKQNGSWNLDTGSGSIKISLPEDAAFDLDAETNSGSIYTEHPITVQGKIARRHLRGKIRGGGSLLHARSGSGSIRIE
jgi:DUF4097 and DUF4098 domain-containing protein YvlB